MRRTLLAQLQGGGGAGAESNTPSAGDFDSQRLRTDRHEELDITSVGDERMRNNPDRRPHASRFVSWANCQETERTFPCQMTPHTPPIPNKSESNESIAKRASIISVDPSQELGLEVRPDNPQQAFKDPSLRTMR